VGSHSLVAVASVAALIVGVGLIARYNPAPSAELLDPAPTTAPLDERASGPSRAREAAPVAPPVTTSRRS
jgi:hypothetical protein